MNDSELEAKLKAVRVPARTDEYWENFPGRVRLQLYGREFAEPAHTLVPRFAWSGGLALACLILSFSLLPAFQALPNDERAFRHELNQLPNQLHALMADEHGMYYLVADRP